MTKKLSTLPEILRPLMDGPSVDTPCCAICGRPHPLNRHHIVRRGAGRLYDDSGRELEKPTIMLCGFGNNLTDYRGRLYCHGLAHANRLHFRWCEDHWEYAVFPEPIKYQDALKESGWKMLPDWDMIY